MTATLDERFARHLEATGLIAPGDTVLVAISGGRDSVTLLHLLRFALAPWALELTAAHFDHRMRAGSAADADWTAGLCRAWSVPLVRGAAENRLESEADARSARYDFLRRAADDVVCTTIATAHHADDQAETVLFRIARGTGLRGLAGIPPRRGPFVRPLLPFRRGELAEYARAAGLRYREDPTNRSLAPARNRIRHEILPRLDAVSPGAPDALARLAANARAAERGWDAVLTGIENEVVLHEDADTVELARPRLLSYHSYVRARVLRRLLRRFGSTPDRAGTRAALEFIRSGVSGHGMRVRGGVVLEREFDRIRVLRGPRQDAAEDRPLVIERPASGAGEAVIGGRRFAVRWTTGPEGGARRSMDAVEAVDGRGAQEAFDPDGLPFPLELRSWRPGDRIRLSYGRKKLKKLFGERRVPGRERGRVPVLADARGAVRWVVGVARAEGAGPVAGGPVFHLAVSNVENH